MKAIQGLVLVLLILAMASEASPRGTAGAKITIEAKRYSFSPSEITVRKGHPVTLEIISQDVTHGLVVKELGLRVDNVKKGEPAIMTFTPETVGTFIGRCAHFCGVGHGSMALTIHVTE